MSAAAGRRYPWNRVRPEGFRLTSALQSGQFLTRGDPQGARDGTRQFVYATVIPLAALLLGLATVGCGETPPEVVVVVEEPGSGLLAEDAQNVRLVGYHDLQGRDALMVTALSDAANGDWAYVGHLESTWDGRSIENPITGAMEWSGTSILDVARAPPAAGSPISPRASAATRTPPR